MTKEQAEAFVKAATMTAEEAEKLPPVKYYTRADIEKLIKKIGFKAAR